MTEDLWDLSEPAEEFFDPDPDETQDVTAEEVEDADYWDDLRDLAIEERADDLAEETVRDRLAEMADRFGRDFEETEQDYEAAKDTAW